MRRIHVKWLERDGPTGQLWRYEWIWAKDLPEFIRYWKARPLREIYYRLGVTTQRVNAQGDIWERV